MPNKKVAPKLSRPIKPKTVDPVREVIQQVRTAGVALGQLLQSMSAGDHRLGDGQESAVSLTVSRSKVSGLILEFATSSPGRRQTIQLLLIGDRAFLQIPGSEKLVQQIKRLAKIDQKMAAPEQSKRIR